MKRKWGFLLVAALLWLPAGPALAGHDAGNGGYTVRCDHASPDGNHLETLDYHEIRAGRYPFNTFTVDLGGQGDEWTRIRYVLKRLSRLDPERAAAYQDKADHFLANADWVASVPDPADSGLAWLVADNCHAIPTVIQYHGSIPEQRTYTISKDLYNALSPDHRAGLILHEIVYGEALTHGAQDSVGARYFTALASSREIGAMNQKDYQVRVAAAGLTPEPQLGWLNNPIVLPDAQENVPYQQSLAPYVQNPDGQPLTFSKVEGPSWLVVAADGTLNGTPARTDVGQFNAVISVTNGAAIVQTDVVLTVAPGNDLAWTKNPIDLGTFEPGRVVTADLSPFVMSSGAGSPGSVTFSVKSAPAWLTLSSTGVLAGTPRDSDIGSFAFEVTATDSKGSAMVKVQCTVGSFTWNFSVVERHSLQVNLNQVQYVGALAGPGLQFQPLNPPTWALISPSGMLTLTPGHADIGSYTFSVAVANGGDHGLTKQITVEVLKEQLPPIWNPDPITYVMKVGQIFTANLSQFVACPDGSPITFSLLGGPTWLSISAAGAISGTPTESDVGANSFIVSATSGDGLTAQDTLIIHVTK